MAESPIQSITQKWNQRAMAFSRQGVPAPIIKEIGTRDIDRVKRGGQGMTDTEARHALSAAIGRPIIEKSPGTKLTDIPGNIVQDIGDVGRGLLKLPQAIAGIPSDIKNTVKNIEFTSEWHSPGEGFRELNKAPIAKWVPFIDTGAKLSTAEGREELKQHPLGPVLDVAALGIPGSKALGGAKLAKEGLLTTQGKRAFTIAPEAEGRLAASAAKGQIVRHGIKKLPVVGDYVKKLEQKIALSRGASISEAEAKRDFEPIAAKLNEVTRIVEDAGVDSTKFYDDITRGIRPDDPNLQVAYDNVIEATEFLQNKYLDMEKLVNVEIDGKDFIYAAEGRGKKLVASRHKLDFHQEKLLNNRTRWDEAQEWAEKKIETYSARADKAKDEIETIIASEPPTLARRKKVERREQIIKTSLARAEAVKSSPKYTKAKQRYESRLDLVNKHQKKLDDRILKTAPPVYHPQLQDIIRARTEAKIASMEAPPEVIEAAMRDLELGKYYNFYTPKEWRELVDDIESTWQELVREGFDPIFVHTVPSNAFNRQSLKPLDHHFTPSQVRERTWSNMTPTRQSIAVSLSHASQEYLRYLTNERAFFTYILPHTKTLQEIDIDIEPLIARAQKKNPRRPLADIRSEIISNEYRKISDPEVWSFRTPRIRALMKEKELFLPTHLYKTWNDLSFPKEIPYIGKPMQKVTAVFKTSLFALSLRHMADELFGGTVMLLGRGDIKDLTSFPEAVRMVKENRVPIELPQSIDIDTPDQLVKYFEGSKGAKIMEELHGRFGALERFNIFVANVQRSMAFLGEQKRATSAGYGPDVARDMAIKHVEKTLVDYYSMLPIERTIIKSIFPFYSFIRYTMRYVLTYPLDHPYRASIIYHLTRAEQEDFDSGLPQLWQQLWFFGDPDPAGYISASDIKPINPFRDVGNFFTLQGFIQSLGPVPKLALIPFGGNPITGSPDMYPELTYDPESGKLVSKRPGVREMATEAVSGALPPIGAIDHFLQFSSSLRNLKATDEEAYRRQLFSALQIPFVPSEYNIPVARARSELARLSDASKAVSSELRGGDSPIERFNAVPFQGQLVSPESIADLVAKLETITPEDATPRAVLPSSRRPKTPLTLPEVPNG